MLTLYLSNHCRNCRDFTCFPYDLKIVPFRLNLPGEIKCDSENAKYLADEGGFKC